ncbi:kinase-like protein [Pseudovirgaria hyperparasitica]|uniref:Kinase-like protein n=1 Tax=Pseudovirgaria hyperparasitica TaxID=470096 RepID=A0A6A6WDK0_9PEZI|nr:kinase-like protein [Pseudovirgaria hyperparasitica]KAF2760908.1 kinase-like protein [Pseudovirgaria hyperparasitica]
MVSSDTESDGSEHTTEPNTIERAISKEKKRSQFHKTESGFFLPNDAINRILTKEAIAQATAMKETDASVNYTFKFAKRLFAIVVYSVSYNDLGRSILQNAMESFKKANINDHMLPLIRDETVGASARDSSLKYFFKKYKKRIWKSNMEQALDTFEERQWMFLAPTFSSDVKSTIDVPWCAPLPFVSRAPSIAEGSFGWVYHYDVHGAHIDDIGSQHSQPSSKYTPRTVAVKEFRKRNGGKVSELRKAWEAEAENLVNVEERDSSHIVHFIAAFRRCYADEQINEYYLMFEWADGGSLRQLWEVVKPRPDVTFVRTVFDQLIGITRAIRKCHYRDSDGDSTHYRHGDLKPENILWFRTSNDINDIGTLKIGDWGIAKGHTLDTTIRVNNTSTRFGTQRYEPPESETGLVAGFEGQSEKRISRLYDIWAMGCIILEFLSWMLNGYEGLSRFNQYTSGSTGREEPFYELEITKLGDRKKAVVHRRVVEEMNRMAKHPRCLVNKTALGDLLQLVRDHILVVGVPNRTASVNHNFEHGTPEQCGTSPIWNNIHVGPGNGGRSTQIVHDRSHNDTPMIAVRDTMEEAAKVDPESDYDELPQYRYQAKKFLEALETIKLKLDNDVYQFEDAISGASPITVPIEEQAMSSAVSKIESLNIGRV